MNKLNKSFKASIVGAYLLALCSFAGPASADRGECADKAQCHQKKSQKMQSELGLSTAQADQIKQIMESKKAETKQLREQMKATFTDEQRAAMKQKRKDRKRGERQRLSKEQRQEQRQAHMAELGISQGQIQQMKALRQQMREQRKATHTQIAAILTPDQQAKFEEMRKKRKDKRGHKRGRHHRGGSEG